MELTELQRSSISQRVRDLIDQLGEQTFTHRQIAGTLIEQDPELADRPGLLQLVSSILCYAAQQGQLERAYHGRPGVPTVYRRPS